MSSTVVGRFRQKLTADIALRVAADIVMVNAALVAALLVRLVVLAIILWRRHADASFIKMVAESAEAYASWAGLVTAVCVSCFALSGFYTYGRSYMSRYKLLIVARALCTAYLILGTLSLFLPIASELSRSALFGSWLLAGTFVMGSRLWADAWRRTASRQMTAPPPRSGDAVRDVLVIGGAGYIGSLLVRQLLGRRYRVRVLDSFLYGNDSLRDLDGVTGLHIVNADFRDITAVVNAMQNIDAVVHLGALVGDPACAVDEKLTVSINVAAARMVGEVAKGAGVRRLVFASTCSVYGANDEVLNEKSDLNPVSVYARSKIASEDVLLQLSDDTFAVSVLRFATLFGLSPRPRFDLVTNVLTAMAVREKRITIMGGDQWRPFLHVADAAEAIVRTLETPAPAVQGRILNVGSDSANHRIADVGAMVVAAIPGVTVEEKAGDGDRRNYRVSFRSFRERVGFIPQRTVAEGIHELRDALLDGRIGDFRDPQYSNYQTLTEEEVIKVLRRDDSWERFVRGAPILARPPQPLN